MAPELVAGGIELVLRPNSSVFQVGAVALAAALVVGYLLFRAGGISLQSYRLAGQEQHVEQEIAELQRQHDELVALREYLRSDEYLEAMARRVLGLVKPGETLVIVNGPEEEASGTPTEEDNGPGQPWWRALFEP